MRGFEAARDEAKLPASLTFHDLRHAAASRLIASGLDDAMVADQIGHGDTVVTRKVYAHVYNRKTKLDAVRAALHGAVAQSEPADLDLSVSRYRRGMADSRVQSSLKQSLRRRSS